MTIEFTELSGSILKPGVFAEYDFNSLFRGLPSSTRKVLLIGHQTSAGSASAGDLERATSEDKAIELWGKGSDLAIMVKELLRQRGANTIQLYGMSYAEDGAAVAGSGDVVFATTATGPGEWMVTINGIVFRGGIENTDTPTAVGDDLAAKVNGHPNCPVTASNSSGTVTMTSRNKGPHANTIRMRGWVTAGIGMTVTPLTDTALTSGATGGDPTTQLANIQSERFHIYVSHTDDATINATIEAHVDTLSDAAAAKWGIMIQGAAGTGSAADTIATARANRRAIVVSHQNSPVAVMNLAAAVAGVHGAKADLKKSVNGTVVRGIPAQYTAADRYTAAEIEARLEAGVAALEVNRTGEVEVSRLVHSYITDPVIFRDINPIELADYLAEDLITTFKTRYKGAALKSASPANTAGVLTPERAKLVVIERLLLAEKLDYVQGTADIVANDEIKAAVNASDATRLDIGLPFMYVSPLGVVAIKFNFTTPPLV